MLPKPVESSNVLAPVRCERTGLMAKSVGGNKERRRYRRFRLKEGTFALLTGSRPGSGPVGRMVNLGPDGASFLHFSPHVRLPPHRLWKLTVVTSDNLFYLGDVPVKVVFDSAMANEFPASRSRRCGVKFQALTDRQQWQLEKLMRDYVSECSKR